MKSISITETVKNKTFTITGNQIGELEGWEYPSVISAIDDIPSDIGALYVNSKFGRRRFSILGFIREMTYENKVLMSMALRQTGSLKLVKFKTLDDLELQTYAEVLSVDYKYRKLATSFLIELVSPDPRFYSQELYDTEIKDNETISITNLGDEVTCPKFKISGAGTFWKVTNTTSGKSLSINRELNGTDYVEIDCQDKSVLLNGSISVFSDFDGDFFNLEPGANQIKLEVTGGGVSSLLNVFHRDAYVTLIYNEYAVSHIS